MSKIRTSFFGTNPFGMAVEAGKHAVQQRRKESSDGAVEKIYTCLTTNKLAMRVNFGTVHLTDYWATFHPDFSVPEE